MAIDKELEANILRYHFVEKWGINTIATQLNIHHSTVDRVLSQAGLPKAERAKQPSILDPYHSFIVDTLEKFPKLTAARLYAMALERGYIRDNFFAGRQWSGIEDLKTQANTWCSGQSANRPCPEDTSMSVRDAFEKEKPVLITLPDNPFPTEERVEMHHARCINNADENQGVHREFDDEIDF